MIETRGRFGKVILQVVLSVIVLPFLLPLVAMVQGSLAGEGWGNYGKVLAVPGFADFFRNSAIIAGSTVLIVYAVSLLAAFGLSKLYIRAREMYFWLIVACSAIPEVVLLAPMFGMASRFGLFNTYWAVILPLAALHIPFALLLARNFTDGMPNELFEAARVDGTTSFGTFRHIVLPLSRPIGAAIIVFTLLAAWNDYLLPLVFLQDTSTQTTTLIPQFFVGEFTNDQTKVLASAVITALPEIAAYLLLQRRFERGLIAGALK